MRISKGLKQAYDLQDFTYEATLALRDSLLEKSSLRQGKQKGKMFVSREDASAIGSLVKAWESCQERIRIHRNKPMPGVLRPEGKKHNKGLATKTLVEAGPNQPSRSGPQAKPNGEAAASPEDSDVKRPLVVVTSISEGTGSI